MAIKTHIGIDANNNKIKIMPVTIAQNSIETMSRIIRSEFDKFTNPWEFQQAKDIIKVAEDFGLTELANEMKNDLND